MANNINTNILPNISEPLVIKKRFDIPKSVGRKEFMSITIKELTPGEEILAIRKAGATGNQVEIGYALARESIYAINDNPVNRAQAEDEIAWSKFCAKLRSLVVRAYAELNAPDESEAESFFASAKVVS